MVHVKFINFRLAIRLVLFFLLFHSSWTEAAYQAEGYGATPEQAKKNALASLSESLLVQVKSEFKSVKSSDGQSSAKQTIETSSGLPLLGVELVESEVSGEFYCRATLNSSKSLPLYESRIRALLAQANRLNTGQQKQQGNQRYLSLESLLASRENLDQYQTVAGLLGMAPVNTSLPDSALIRSQILQLESASQTLDIAVSALTRDLPDLIYHLQAPLPFGSSQGTKLSRLIQLKMRQKLRTTDDISQAASYLAGSYEIVEDGIIVSYRVINSEGGTEVSRVVKLSPKAYEKVSYQPVSTNFDQLLHEGYVVSNSFRVELNTNQGKTGLLFSGGETIELFVKMNAPGYFYIVAHNDIEKLSYLLELNQAPGKRAFVRFVNADDANRWLSLGEFEVTRPFGTENLQLIASSIDLIDKLPAYHYQPGSELYVLQASSLSNAVIKTRGLKPKKKTGVKSAEVTLTYTSME